VSAPERDPKKSQWVRWVVLTLVIGISVYIFLIPETQLEKLAAYGFLGIFSISIISNATVLIPAPGLLIVFSLGARLNPLWVGVIAGIGAAIGELSGYMAGYGGQTLIENAAAYDRMVAWMQKNGPLTVILLALIPNPIFDLTGIAAGALKMPVWQFLFWAMIGKIGKMLLVAYAGVGLSSPWIN
jgi:uncharacterized membrane protein YdjX (TVP38/TMEM64 family)